MTELGSPRPLLLAALGDSKRLGALGPKQWDTLIRQARRCRVLSRIALDPEARRLEARLPERVADHLAAARHLAGSYQRNVHWEVNRVRRALRGLQVPIILLKGAAYAVRELPPARGRLATDIDIMVPREALAATQRALQSHGWEPFELDDYDQQYYLRWMHELPPLRHRERRTIVDVHHTILPPTSRLKPDPAKLWQSARLLKEPDLFTLSQPDMVLHSAAHLFHDGDLNLAIRDVVDIGDLLRTFGAEPGFWPGLVPRARELDLARPLFYALRYTTGLLDAAVPEAVMTAAQAGAPPRLALAIMDRLVPRVLLPGLSGSFIERGDKAATLLYIRSHWLRMPPGLLARHLGRKALKRSSETSERGR
jgi:hypothetical protein